MKKAEKEEDQIVSMQRVLMQSNEAANFRKQQSKINEKNKDNWKNQEMFNKKLTKTTHLAMSAISQLNEKGRLSKQNEKKVRMAKVQLQKKSSSTNSRKNKVSNDLNTSIASTSTVNSPGFAERRKTRAKNPVVSTFDAAAKKKKDSTFGKTFLSDLE